MPDVGDPGVKEFVRHRIPLRRWGKPGEIAGAASSSPPVPRATVNGPYSRWTRSQRLILTRRRAGFRYFSM